MMWIRLAMVAGALSLAGCQDDMVREEGPTACEDPRPEICTREYLPVCATRADGTTGTYGNWCDACADEKVESYVPGACP